MSRTLHRPRRSRPIFLVELGLAVLAAESAAFGAEPLTTKLTAQSGQWSESVVPGISPAVESFVIEVQIDPVEAESGDLEVVAGVAIGLENIASSPCGAGAGPR